MSGLDIFTWIVVLILVATVGIVFAVLGMLPGKVARQLRHPQVKAIAVGALLVSFPFALLQADTPDLEALREQARAAYLRSLDFVPDGFWANHDVALLMRRSGEPLIAFQPYARRALELLPDAAARGVIVAETLQAVRGTLERIANAEPELGPPAPGGD